MSKTYPPNVWTREARRSAYGPKLSVTSFVTLTTSCRSNRPSAARAAPVSVRRYTRGYFFASIGPAAITSAVGTSPGMSLHSRTSRSPSSLVSDHQVRVP